MHEAYLRLVGDPEIEWGGRAHFFGAAVEAMRRILVEEARRRVSLKRGGDRVRIELEELQLADPEKAEDLVDLTPESESAHKFRIRPNEVTDGTEEAQR